MGKGDGQRVTSTTDEPLAQGQRVEAPFQLPADNPDFTNRAEEMSELLPALDRDPEKNKTTAATVGITGPPVSGKSQLAIHLAHTVTSRYPNGCFVIDLGGPLTPSQAVADGLADLLWAQGRTHSEIPETLE